MTTDGFSSRVALSYVDGEDRDGEPLDSINPLNLVVGVYYDTNIWGAGATLSYTASKDRDEVSLANRDNFLPSSSTVVDLTVYYNPIKNVTLRAGLFNATDEEYYNWNNTRGVASENRDLTQASRNWAFTAKYDF